MIIEKCPDTLGLMDDVIVYGKIKEEYDRNLHSLMKISQVKGLRFNCEKCTVAQNPIHFLEPYMTKTENALTRKW